VVSDDIVVKDGVYLLLYHGRNSRYYNNLWFAGLATSTDLHTWVRYPYNPVGPSVSDTAMLVRVPDPNGAEDQFMFHIYEPGRGIGRYFPWIVTTPRVYIDGVEDEYWGRDDFGSLPIHWNGSALALGRMPAWPAGFYPGLIDEAYVFDRALSPNEIQELYASTVAFNPGPGPFDFEAFTTLMECMTGPQGSLEPGCHSADLDRDYDVDLGDFAWFQIFFSP